MKEDINFGTNVKGDLTINDIESGVPLYHRPKDSSTGDPLAIIKSLMTYGFSREYTGDNGGNMYGPGVYNVYTLRSSNESATGYGKFIVKSFLLGGYKDFLIFNEEMAKDVYGNDWEIDKQMKKLFPEKILNDVFSRFHVHGAKPNRGRGNVYTIGGLYMNNNSTLKNVKTSNIAVQITDYLRGRIAQTRVRGIIYSGNHDGECAFVRNFSDVIPCYYSKDNGKTWIKAITDELIWRAGHNTDVEATLKHAVDDKGAKAFSDTAERSINGFVLVFKNGKVNYFEVATNKLISNVWFDYATNFDEYGLAEVLYKNNRFYLEKTEDGFIIGDDEEGPICNLLDLPKTIQESTNKSSTLFKEICESVLNEDKKLVDNFDLISNMLTYNSSDDFYFVQIIKRFKDNPNDDRTQGNYHAGGWYLKGYRIKSADELNALKPEIIKICEDNNARAYITINSRSEKETNDFIKIYRKKYRPTDPRFTHADDIVPGQAKDGPSWKGKRPRLFLDVDVTKDKKSPDGRNIWDEVRYMLKMVGLTPLAEYETPSGGLHIILPDKEDARLYYLKKLFNKFDNWQNKGKLATVHPNIDGKIILYSNVQTKGY